MDEKKIDNILTELFRIKENLDAMIDEINILIDNLRIELPDYSVKKAEAVAEMRREDILNDYINRAKVEEQGLSEQEKEKRDLFLENFGGER